MKTVGKTRSAYEVIRRPILNGSYAPGAPLRIAALAKEYGISATPLREALSRLEEKRLVVASPNCGWRVAPVSLDELEDLEHARLSIEEILLRDSIECGGLDWEGDVIAAHHRLRGTPQPIGRDTLEDRERWVEAHDSFHASLISAGKSSWLKSFHETTLEQLQRHHQALLFHPGSINPERASEHSDETLELLHRALAHEHHTQLMQASLDRDVDAAMRLLREHVQITLSVYRSIAAREANDQPKKTTRQPTERT